MKFFDLEMNNCLAVVAKRGGRDVSFAEGKTCDNFKFTNGNNMYNCMANQFEDHSNKDCKVHYEPIK